MHTLEDLRAGRLAGITRLQLACGLTEFPPEIYSLADSLEILDLSNNALVELPDDLPRLHRLRIIFCSNNPFTHLPEVLGSCSELSMIGFKSCRIRTVSARALPPRLRWLVLTDNQVESLPEELGLLPLQKLMLAGNRLRTLPVSLAGCSTLELLRLAANQLADLPHWLADLPRLSWLAIAGNPLGLRAPASAASAAPAVPAVPAAPAAPSAAMPPVSRGEQPGTPASDCPDVPWSALHMGWQLGEGASGVIFAATLDERPVAVKLFKGAVTSDGLPDSEMDACIAAGAHPNLIPVLGRVIGHPAGTHGLVLTLIDPHYRNLAGPPSLDSCTRDIYAADKRFDLQSALRIATGIASAARHLHARGILHGDLYAHNILHCSQGNPLLGDFGAAAFYNPDATWLQRLEVRAFGCLLEELLDRIEAPPSAQAVALLMTLAALRDECLAAPPARPLFAQIERRLAALDKSI